MKKPSGLNVVTIPRVVEKIHANDPLLVSEFLADGDVAKVLSKFPVPIELREDIFTFQSRDIEKLFQTLSICLGRDNPYLLHYIRINLIRGKPDLVLGV